MHAAVLKEFLCGDVFEEKKPNQFSGFVRHARGLGRETLRQGSEPVLLEMSEACLRSLPVPCLHVRGRLCEQSDTEMYLFGMCATSEAAFGGMKSRILS